MPSSSLLEELTPSQDEGAATGPTSRLELGQGNFFGLVLRVPQPNGTDSAPRLGPMQVT
jgi:hypothetical protein